MRSGIQIKRNHLSLTKVDCLNSFELMNFEKSYQFTENFKNGKILIVNTQKLNLHAYEVSRSKDEQNKRYHQISDLDRKWTMPLHISMHDLCSFFAQILIWASKHLLFMIERCRKKEKENKSKKIKLSKKCAFKHWFIIFNMNLSCIASICIKFGQHNVLTKFHWSLYRERGGGYS